MSYTAEVELQHENERLQLETAKLSEALARIAAFPAAFCDDRHNQPKSVREIAVEALSTEAKKCQATCI